MSADIALLWTLVAFAGAAGAACRYVVDFLVTARTAGAYPLGTLVVNVTGALLIGVLSGLVAHQGAPSVTRTILGAGFCGAYTTFSTLIYESWQLLEDRAYRRAAANVATLALSLPAAGAGWALAALPG